MSLDPAPHRVMVCRHDKSCAGTMRRLLLLFESERLAWRGEQPLATVFWGYGVAIGVVLALLHAMALDQEQLAFEQLLILVSAAYTMWIVVAIWRSAVNAAPFWGTLARWLSIAWALNSGFVLLFLQIELLLRLAGR